MNNCNRIMRLIRIGQRGFFFLKVLLMGSRLPAAKSVIFYSMVDQLKGQEASPASLILAGSRQAGVSSCTQHVFLPPYPYNLCSMSLSHR